jgi:tripartite-type tricarboxylate transporter receptor subunit TctC
MKRRDFCIAGAAGIASASSGAARAESAWPSRPVRIIVPYTPGGYTDQMARLLQVGLQGRLGQPIVIDNKPGANSIIGVDALAKSPGDGHTFAVVIAAYAANTTLYPKLPYDPNRDLRGVALMGVSPLVAAVPWNAPFKNAREFVAYARANPGKISYGSSGNGSASHLTTELLKLQAMSKDSMVHIPYRGNAPAIADLIAGQIQLLFGVSTELIPTAKDNRIRFIGVASEERLSALPEVPTFIEQGFAGFTGSTWAGMLAQASTPEAIVVRMAKEVREILRSGEMLARLDAMGTLPSTKSTKEFDAFIAGETAKWANVIRSANIKADS